jgi:hypothetical protein
VQQGQIELVDLEKNHTQDKVENKLERSDNETTTKANYATSAIEK